MQSRTPQALDVLLQWQARHEAKQLKRAQPNNATGGDVGLIALPLRYEEFGGDD